MVALDAISIFSTQVRKQGYLHADLATRRLAGDELLPGVGALADDIESVPRGWTLARIHNIRYRQHILLVLALAGESELVLGLSVGDLVDTEPLVGGAEEAREVALNILNVVKLGSQGVVDVDDNDLPVGLLLVEKSHHTKDLNLLDLTGVADELTDLANVERVVVTLGLGLGVDSVGVFPGLCRGSVRGGTNFDVALFLHTWGKAP